MQVQHKHTGAFGSAGRLNTHGVGEMIVWFPGGDATSDAISDYKVELADGTWTDLADAFRRHDVITDNYNTAFFEPPTPADRARGYTL